MITKYQKIKIKNKLKFRIKTIKLLTYNNKLIIKIILIKVKTLKQNNMKIQNNNILMEFFIFLMISQKIY